MHDVQIARLDEQQKASAKRLENLESAKIDARLEHLETIVGENQAWLRMAVAGVTTTAIGMVAQILLQLRRGRKRE